MPAGATSSATPDTEGVFKAFVVAIKGEMVTDGGDLAEGALAGFVLWGLVCSEAGVDMRRARICGGVECVATSSTAGTG